ncbi:hypothetical protein PV325_008272 [Microctonus aethiopoides]|nr:hypothetical protein PV325_008272 [Microctonus aethiopoides]
MKYHEWAMVRRDESYYTIVPSNSLYIKINAEWTQLNKDSDLHHGEPVSRCSDPQIPQDSYKLIAFANTSEELWQIAKGLGASDQEIEVINQDDGEKKPENAAFTKPLSLVWIENERGQKDFSIVPTPYVFIKRSSDAKYRNIHSHEKIKTGEEVKVLMGMTNKTMTFVMFGDSYEKLNDVANLYDRTAKPKRIKFVKRRTFSPPKNEAPHKKVVPGSSNARNKKKPNKENFLRKKTKCTSREHAEEDGDNVFLQKIMEAKKKSRKMDRNLGSMDLSCETRCNIPNVCNQLHHVQLSIYPVVDGIDATVTPNILSTNSGMQNAEINLSGSHSHLDMEIASHSIFKEPEEVENGKASTTSILTPQDCRQIVREELQNFTPLLIEELGHIPREANQLRIPPMDNDEMVTMEGVRLHYTLIAEAQSSETMRKRANAIMKGMWNEEERMHLVIKKNKRTPPDKREITPREYEKIQKICLALQTNRSLPQMPDKDHLMNLRRWAGDLLKNKNYLKRKQDRNLELDQTMHPQNGN